MSAEHVMTVAVSSERIISNLRTFARIGYRMGGIQRLAFTKADLQARQVLVQRLQRAGLNVRIDDFGNVFGRYTDVENPDAPPMLVGSHLDAVPSGGRFDGSVGIVAALETVFAAKDAGVRLERPLEVVSFACEESSRFGRGTLGSGLVAGVWDPEEVVELRDSRGARLGQVLRRLGLNPDGLASLKQEPGTWAAFLEIHIEQGRVLEVEHAHVGVVDAIAAPTRFRLTIHGNADHSGATPMGIRSDALAAAAEIILSVERNASEATNVVGTVGTARVTPGAINVVPGEVELGIDVRATSSEQKRRVVEKIHRDVAEILTRRGLTSSLQPLSDEEPVPMDKRMVQLIEDKATLLNHPYVRMPSGAGHDAMQMAQICPSGMLLVPSKGGYSHNPSEWTDLDDVVRGIDVYVNAAVAMSIGSSVLPTT